MAVLPRVERDFGFLDSSDSVYTFVPSLALS